MVKDESGSGARRPTAGRPATLADIAAELGVSRQLVSIAMNGKSGASAETRQRVMETARRLGYSPHMGARVLRQSASRHIGVAFSPAHATEPDIVEAIYPAAKERGYQVVASPITSTRPPGLAVEELLGYRCAAIILIGPEMRPAELNALAHRAAVPLVTVGAGNRNDSYDVVRSAGDAGIELAVRHLAELGHVHATFVHAPRMPPGARRLAGFRRATKRLSLGHEVLEVEGDYTEQGGAQAASMLLARDSLPTAVVMGNDQAAIGLILTMARAGVDVPGQVSVTGFDDSRLAHLSCVDLTTVRQDPSSMGEVAVAAALNRLASIEAEPRAWVVETSLVVRGSTGPPRKGTGR